MFFAFAYLLAWLLLLIGFIVLLVLFSRILRWTNRRLNEADARGKRWLWLMLMIITLIVCGCFVWLPKWLFPS